MSRYSNSIVYKLCCTDVSVTDIYVGSTCNFAKRKSQHKSKCLNESAAKHNLPVYQYIRENGGWENWQMVQLLSFSCQTPREKELKEREFVDLLKPKLNRQIPTRGMKEYRELHKVKQESVLCECGSKCTPSNKTQHGKSTRHQTYKQKRL